MDLGRKQLASKVKEIITLIVKASVHMSFMSWLVGIVGSFMILFLVFFHCCWIFLQLQINYSSASWYSETSWRHSWLW
jgi:hypothetical protein